METSLHSSVYLRGRAALTCAHSATLLTVPAMLHSQPAGETTCSGFRWLNSNQWSVCVCVCISHWSIHQVCQGTSSSTAVYMCHRPDPPHGDDTHTDPSNRSTVTLDILKILIWAKQNIRLTTGGSTTYWTEPAGWQEPASRDRKQEKQSYSTSEAAG